jgi:hypothetical protein
VRPSAAQIRTLLRGLALVGLFLFVIALRVVTSAREELLAAEACLAARDTDGAIVHYRRAARWYAPGSPYHRRALERLAVLGQQFERARDFERALSAYRSARGAIMATRSLFVPEPARLAYVNQRIARIMAEELPAPGMDAGKSQQQLLREHLALLQQVPGPDPFWTCVLLCGFLGWIAAALAFSVRAIDAQDRWVRPEALRWGALIALGFSLFVLGMSLA